MRKTRKNTQNIKRRRYKHWLVAVLLAVLPGLALAYEVYDPDKDYPCLCDTMPADDLCEIQVSRAQSIWLAQRSGVFYKLYMNQSVFNEALYLPAGNEGSVQWVLTKLASDLAWAGQDLRQVEKAVLKKCRTWPDEALRAFGMNYGLK